jgi:tRNA-splicing endonuclease subunit Sen34
LTLRQDHRIVGSLIGTLSQAPRQVQQSGLPLLLMPEEIDLLLQQNVISLFRFKNPESFSDEYRNKFQLQREMNFQSQVEVFKEDRKSEIHRMADKIVEGKKRKKTRKSSEEIVILNDVSEDNETILQREIDKIGDLPRHQALLQTFTGTVNYLYSW